MISTRGRYAIRVLLDLAEHDTGHAVPLKEIAERQAISKKYLEIIVKDMVNAQLLSGSSGRGGGYRLCRKPEEYIIGEVLELLEGSLAPVVCIADPGFNCPRRSDCETIPMWIEYDKMVHDFFWSRRLSDLISENARRSSPENSEA